jgi:hypothetical protein
MSNSVTLRIWGYCLLALGAAVIGLLRQELPEPARLVEVAGELRSLDTSMSKGGGLSAVRFSLSTDNRQFQYHSKAGGIDAVWQALSQAGRAQVRVRMDPQDAHTPWSGGPPRYTVYALRVGDVDVRSQAQVAEAWSTDNLVGAGLGLGAIAGGAILLLLDYLKRWRAS